MEMFPIIAQRESKMPTSTFNINGKVRISSMMLQFLVVGGWWWELGYSQLFWRFGLHKQWKVLYPMYGLLGTPLLSFLPGKVTGMPPNRLLSFMFLLTVSQAFPQLADVVQPNHSSSLSAGSYHPWISHLNTLELFLIEYFMFRVSLLVPRGLWQEVVIFVPIYFERQGHLKCRKRELSLLCQTESDR